MALWYYSLWEAESSSVEAQLEEEYLGLSKRESQRNTWLFLRLSRYSYALKTSSFRAEPQEPYERRRDFISKRILTDFKKVIWQQIRIYAEILACVSYVRKTRWMWRFRMVSSFLSDWTHDSSSSEHGFLENLSSQCEFARVNAQKSSSLYV